MASDTDITSTMTEPIMAAEPTLSPAKRSRLRRQRERELRRSRWRMVLIGGALVLVVYYGLVFTSMRGNDSNTVALDETRLAHPPDRITLQVEAADLDTGNGSLDLQIRPVPHGNFESARPGELSVPLQLQVVSSGGPAESFDFPAAQLVDPVAVSIDTSGGAHGFPFDRPRMDFRLAALSGEQLVPIDVKMADGTEGWNLSGTVRGDDGVLRVAVDAGRETLAISFAIFYIAGIVVIALITVAVIGGAVARGRVDFNQIIWLGAMLVAIPAVRNEMPGVPPIGTAVDLFVFFPSIVIVGVALLAGVVVLAVVEAAEARAEPATSTGGDGD